MIDIEELKRLPTHVKVDLIDQLLYSIDANEENEQEEDEGDADLEIVKEMEQRLDDMESGKLESYTWEEAKAILAEDLLKYKASRGNV